MRMNGEHLDEEIELYALGMLEDDERLHVETHAGGCGTCAERLGRAEATVAQMVDATVGRTSAPRELLARIPVAADGRPRRRRLPRALYGSPTRWIAAAAVACALTAGVFARQNAELRSNIFDDGAAFHAMIDSHFSHAPFVSPDGASLAVKVVYERHGGWYEVLAHDIDPQSHIVIVRGRTAMPFSGSFARRGDVFTLALPDLEAVSELRLVDSRGRTVGRVRPILSPPAK